MLERVNQYIYDKEFRFTVFDNRIHIINFKRIIVLEEDLVLLQSNQKKIRIVGTRLVLNKLLDHEMLLMGNIQKIEVEND